MGEGLIENTPKLHVDRGIYVLSSTVIKPLNIIYVHIGICIWAIGVVGIVVHMVIDAAVHVLVSLPPGVVVLGCAMPLGICALQGDKQSVQGEVKAHPTTEGTDAR